MDVRCAVCEEPVVLGKYDRRGPIRYCVGCGKERARALKNARRAPRDQRKPLDNVQLAHFACNRRKGARMVAA